MIGNTFILTILIFVCPLAWLGALCLWVWRRAMTKPSGKAPVVFIALVVSHFIGFLCFHADPYWLLDGGGRDYIHPLGQFVLGGSVGTLVAAVLLPLSLLADALLRKRKKHMTFSEINLGCNPFIVNIHEPEENVLVIDVCGSMTEDTSEAERRTRMAEANDPLERLVASANAVDRDESLMYRITFDDYVAYQVLNQSYDGAPDGPVFQGSPFMVFATSRYLDYVRDTALTPVAEFYSDGKPPLHYGMWTVRHIVDVVSCNPPAVRILAQENGG